MQHPQSIKCISISVTNPASHAHIALLEPIPGALFGGGVPVVLTSGVDTATMVVPTVLILVMGPDGPSLTIVLTIVLTIALREAVGEGAGVGFDDGTLSCAVSEVDDGLPPT